MAMKFLSKAKTFYHWVIVNGFLVYKIFVNPKTPWYVRLLFLIPLHHSLCHNPRCPLSLLRLYFKKLVRLGIHEHCAGVSIHR